MSHFISLLKNMRVCVIGAGLSGLCAMRSLQRLKPALEFVVYEQSNRVGGVWIYGDPFKPTNMYQSLRSNLPKEVMTLPGIPFKDKSDEDPSYISHSDYLKYLEDVAEQLELYPYIQFRTRVENVEPVETSDKTQYKVTVKNLQSGEHNSQLFDSVIICNGHYNKPYIPQIEGSETFTGNITHSIEYREPEPYKNKTVVVLGARSSGVDIATEISTHASKVYLAHRKEPLSTIFPANVKQKSAISHIEHSDIYFSDGTVIENVDELMLATGYLYEFPFLADSLQPTNQSEGLVELYKMIVDVNNPNIFYIGLNKVIVPATQFHVQCEYISALLAGEVQLPSRQEMDAENQARFERLVTNAARPEHYYHVLAEEQWAYNKEVILAAGQKPLGDCYEKLYTHVWRLRNRKAMITSYREGIYRIHDCYGDDFTIIKDPPEN